MVLYPNEKYVAIVETRTTDIEWFDLKKEEEFDSKNAYISHRRMWIKQLKEAHPFNYCFVSEEHKMRILLDVEKEISKLEKAIEGAKSEQ
jgi:hypothetical protein